MYRNRCVIILKCVRLGIQITSLNGVEIIRGWVRLRSLIVFPHWHTGDDVHRLLKEACENKDSI